MIEALIFVIFPLCLAISACIDLLTMTIPNRVSVILLAAFLIVAPFAGLGFAEIGLHLLAGLLVFAICFGLFAANVMGGGDAKMLTAASVWFGFNSSLEMFMIYVGLIGGLVTVLVLLIRAHANSAIAVGVPLPPSLFAAKKIPYGVAIGIAGFLAYPSSPLMVAALHRLH